MSLKKSFGAEAVQVSLYRSKQRRRTFTDAVKILTLSVLGGASLGGIKGLYERGYFSQLPVIAREFAISQDLLRRRTPQPGDYWANCNGARTAGVAPLYRGEPGYRPEMDGDDDGIACEPYRGR